MTATTKPPPGGSPPAARWSAQRRSVRRPILVGAVAITLLLVASGALAAYWGQRAVARAAAAESETRTVATARDRSLRDAARSAERVADTLRRGRLAAEHAAQAARTAMRDVQPGPEPAPWEPLGTKGLHWLPPQVSPCYAVAQPADPSTDDLARLAALARSLGPVLSSQLDSDGGVVHVAAWFPGLGLVGAAPTTRPGDLGCRTLAPGWSQTAFAPPELSGPLWVAPGARLARENVVSHVLPVRDADGQRIGIVTADVSFAVLERAFAETARRDPLAQYLLVTSDATVLAAPSGAAQTLGLPPGADAAARSRALRRLLGEESFVYPAANGLFRENAQGLAAAAAVPGIDWTVVLVLPPRDVLVAAAQSGAEAAHASRLSAVAFLVLTLFFGGLVAMAGVALAESFSRRLRPLLEGASAHAEGDLDHHISIQGDDELGVLAVCLNSTAVRLRQNLGRLQESERRLMALIETMADGLLIADSEDRITFTNQRFAELVRRPGHTVIGHYVEEFLVPESVERYRAENRRRREGRSSRYEVTWQAPVAVLPRTLVSGMPMYDGEGAYTGSFAVVTDITERVRAQEETARAEKLRALGEMAGGVAHDFNNVLTVILGNTQYLMLEQLPDDVQSTLRIVERAALDGTETVRRIREFTKARAVPAAAEPVDPNRIVSEVMDMARHRYSIRAREEGVAFEVEVRNKAHRLIRGNASELREALLNIVNNALEAMPAGGRLLVEAFDRGEDSVGLRIEDSGCGMDQDTQNKIFDPFFTTKEGGRCSGLGLSITFGIVRAHGGRIDVRSAPGHGATFTLVLPAETTAPAEPAPAPAAPAEPRVLMVTGEPRTAAPLQRGLRELGVYVAAVSSPASALAIVTDPGIFNTLLVERDLAPGTGWEFARQARAVRPDLRIVLLTDPGQPVDETQARNAGIDRVMVRPFDARDVHATVFALMASAPAHAEAARPARLSTRSRRSLAGCDEGSARGGGSGDGDTTTGPVEDDESDTSSVIVEEIPQDSLEQSAPTDLPNRSPSE